MRVPVAIGMLSEMSDSQTQEQFFVGLPAAASRASMDNVLPKPISSARIPPRKFLGGSACVIPLSVFWYLYNKLN